jgi:hypothetical protein
MISKKKKYVLLAAKNWCRHFHPFTVAAVVGQHIHNISKFSTASRYRVLPVLN